NFAWGREKGAKGRLPGPFHGLGPSSDNVPRAEPRGILVQMHGAGEFDSPLPWIGTLVQQSPLPFHLTPFDPHSEISQRKPCHPPPVPAASPFQPRVRCGHSSSLHRSFPEHASNESRTRPPEKHLKTFPKKMGGPKSTHTIYFTSPIYCHPPPKAL